MKEFLLVAASALSGSAGTHMGLMLSDGDPSFETAIVQILLAIVLGFLASRKT